MKHHRPTHAPLTLLILLLAGCAAEGAPASSAGSSAALEQIDGWEGSGESLDVYFVPEGDELEDRIADAVAGAETSIRVAMYNLRSRRLGYLLLERQRAGVDVQVLLDARQMAKPWNTLDDELGEQGLEIVPIENNRSRYSTLHDKMAVIDGQHVFLGSASWGESALHANNEVILELNSPALATVVHAELDEIISGVALPRTGDVASNAQLYFSPGDRLDRVIEDEIDAATDRVWLAVFSLRLSWLGDALIRAHQRGVDVRVITDRNQSESTDVDDRLRAAGITVIEASNTTGAHTAMHHKFAVIDGHTTLVGSYNWTYTATFHNYEDLAVIADDPEVAAAFEGEMGRLWARYAPEQDNLVSDQMPVAVDVFCDNTQYGDTLVLVGDAPALGAWDPHAGVPLSGVTWPQWSGSVELRAGSRVSYKLVVIGRDGQVRWESGANREALVPTDPYESLVLEGAFRE